MVLIALGMIGNFGSAVWDTYNLPKNRWSDPGYMPKLYSSNTYVVSMTCGFILTVLIPRAYAAYKFSIWLCWRNNEKRLSDLPCACFTGAISTFVGVIWSIANMIIDHYRANGIHSSKDTMWLMVHIFQTILFIWFSGFTTRYTR